jgi:hypothetical protein
MFTRPNWATINLSLFLFSAVTQTDAGILSSLKKAVSSPVGKVVTSVIFKKK